MSIATRIALFALVYLALFFAFMASITGGVIDVVAWASMPVILSAETLILGMIYLTTFHSEVHDEPEKVQPFKLGAYSHVKQSVREQQKV